MPSRHLWAFERGTMWAMDLADPVGGGTTRVSPRIAASLGEVQREAALSLVVAMGLADPALVLQRFDSGRRCFAAWTDDRIIAYGWVSWGVECVGEWERPFHIPGGEAYIWDCATLPAFRRLRLYSALLSYIAATLRGEGTARVWIGASLSNRPSIRGMAVAGFQPVVTLTYVRLFHLSHFWMAGDPAASPSLVAAARQALVASTNAC